MPFTGILKKTVVASACLFIAACASAGGAPMAGTAAEGAPGTLAVHVINDMVPPTTVTILMVPETGGRRRLGSISPNGQQTFSIDPGLRSMEYRLIAQISGEEDRTSNPFVIEDISGVEWRVSSVIIRTTR